MKKILSLALVLILTLSSLGILTASAERPPIEGTKAGDFYYQTLDNGTANIVAYVGNATHLTFPSEIDGYKVTKIMDPFWKHETIISITIPEGVTNTSLWGAENLESITLPDSLEYFNAFDLQYTKLFKNPDNWEAGALYLGNRLVFVNKDLKGVFKVKDGTKFISAQAFVECKKITEIILPDSLVKIEHGAFKECTALNKVTFGKNLEYIGQSAFVLCESLRKIDLPEGLTKIEYGTFNESGIEEITFPSTLKVIENEAFTMCKNLKTITIPDSVTHLGGAFSFCENLSEINLPDTLEFIGSNAFHNTAYANNPDNYEDNMLYYGTYLLDYSDDFSGTCKVKEGTTIVADRLFGGCDTVTSVIFPDGVKGVGDCFFLWCDNLETVTLPKGMTEIGKATFQDCIKLTNINIPEGVTKINESAFTGCKSLNYISIPASVQTITPYSIGYDVSYSENEHYVPLGDNLTIAGTTGSAAEKYAFVHKMNFKNLSASEEYKYKDKVLELLNIAPTERIIYHEGYSYVTNSPEVPEFVLITAYNEASADEEISKFFGDYVLYSPDLKYPGKDFGYFVYIPESNEIFTLTEAFENDIPFVYKVFTEGGLGEIIGDVNYDNNLNIRDVTLLQQHLAGYDNMNIISVHGAYTMLVADFNRDGKMNIRDATAIQKRIAGLDKNLQSTQTIMD